MATSGYLLGRKRYQRPQAVLWADNPGTLSNGIYVPLGYEVGSEIPDGTDSDLINQFIILSDHNRSEISFTPQRIEKRQRTINGRMRSYHIADKLQISFSWSMLPSRSFVQNANFNSTTGISTYKGTTDEYTADGGAGGVQILDWYNSHQGPFWMYLAYDKYSNFGTNNAAFQNLAEYNEIVEVYFSDFNYSVSKRGGSNFDFWNITVTLEEA